VFVFEEGERFKRIKGINEEMGKILQLREVTSSIGI